MKEHGMSAAPGETILAIAVMSILFTAPLGAVAIKWVGGRVLRVDGDEHDATEDGVSK